MLIFKIGYEINLSNLNNFRFVIIFYIEHIDPYILSVGSEQNLNKDNLRTYIVGAGV